MAQYCIGLGSNLGNRSGNLTAAIEAIRQSVGEVVSKSGIYETPPWGDLNQAAFLNACVLVVSEHEPIILLGLLKQIEANLGRKPTRHWGPRVIDLDILLWDEGVYNTIGLEIPHPRIQERQFVLQPLADIAPDWQVAENQTVVGAYRTFLVNHNCQPYQQYVWLND